MVLRVVTGSCCGCSCRDVFICALTRDGFLGYRCQRSARKHRDGSFASSHASLNTMLPRDSQLRYAASMVGPFRLPHHLPCLAVTWMRCHACACCTTVGVGHVCHQWPQQKTLFTASLTSTWYVTFAHHPDGCASSCHRADHSRRMLLSVSHSGDFLTKVY